MTPALTLNVVPNVATSIDPTFHVFRGGRGVF